MRDGYIVLKNAIPDRHLSAAVADLDRAYSGGFDKALFECYKINRKGIIGWQSEVIEHNAKVLDLHHFSVAMRRIMFSRTITNFLKLIFQSNVLPTNHLVSGGALARRGIRTLHMSPTPYPEISLPHG